MSISTFEGRYVERVYSGKPGCCCGCRGTYYYSTTVDPVAAGARRGYPVTPDEFNDRMVSRILNTITKNRQIAEVDDGGVYVSVDLPGRVFIAYFLDTERSAS